MEGKIKFYNGNKGYGFITCNEVNTKEEAHMTANKENLDPQEYFFHVSGLSYKEPQRNEEVTFELEETNRGLKAVNIQKKQNGKQ